MKNYRIVSFFLVVAGTALFIGLPGWSVQGLANNVPDTQDNHLQDDPPDEFFSGKYIIVGQKPANGMSYKGRGSIEIKDNKILLSRTIGGKTTTVTGESYLSGESKKKSLRFEWKGTGGKSEMFCQYSVDFDNYPRLSCIWTDGRKRNGTLPGFESYYPLAALSN